MILASIQHRNHAPCIARSRKRKSKAKSKKLENQKRKSKAKARKSKAKITSKKRKIKNQKRESKAKCKKHERKSKRLVILLGFRKNQTPRAGIEPTTHRFHDWCSTIKLSWQLQWEWPILNTDFQAFAPRPLGLGITFGDCQTACPSGPM